jgi:hypothetical protein
LIQHVEFSFSENTATLKYISEFSNNNQVFSVVVNCGGELSIYNILATTKKNTKIDLKASRVATFLYSKTDYANYDKVTLTATVSNKVGNLV